MSTELRTVSFMQIVSRTSTADYVIPEKIKVSEQCKDFLQRCLTPDPKQRISIQQIYDHPWFKQDLPPQVMASQKIWTLSEYKIFFEPLSKTVGSNSRKNPKLRSKTCRAAWFLYEQNQDPQQAVRFVDLWALSHHSHHALTEHGIEVYQVSSWNCDSTSPIMMRYCSCSCWLASFLISQWLYIYMYIYVPVCCSCRQGLWMLVIWKGQEAQLSKRWSKQTWDSLSKRPEAFQASLGNYQALTLIRIWIDRSLRWWLTVWTALHDISWP